MQSCRPLNWPNLPPLVSVKENLEQSRIMDEDVDMEMPAEAKQGDEDEPMGTDSGV